MGEISHVSSVTEATDTSLTGALVEAGLQSDVTFTGAELLFSEFAFILICHFGTETRTGVLWMFLSKSGESINAERHLRDISPFVQIGCLENLLFWNTTFLRQPGTFECSPS